MKRKDLSILLVLMVLILSACQPTSTEWGLSEPESSPTGEIEPTAGEILESPTPEAALDQSEDERILDPVAEIHPLAAMVEDFYAWHASQPNEAIFGERTYESHSFLSDIFKSDVGYLLDSFEGQSGYDPFTCSQAILPGIKFDPVFVSGGEALVLGQVIESSETRHYFVVHLGMGEGSWKIEAVHCPFEPVTAAIAFYAGYLGHISNGSDMEMGVDDPNNPFQDGYWDQFFLVSDSYRAEIDQIVVGRDPQAGRSDPILQAQAFPLRFWVQPGQEGTAIEASVTFGPYSTRHYIVHLVESPLFTWVVDNIEMVQIPAFDPQAHPEVDTADWETFNIQAYGLSFLYPKGWWTRPADLTGIPPEDPIKQSYFFFPAWADANLPALWVNILEGSESQVMDYYVIESRQPVEINGQTVWVDRDQCETRFVFQHPDRENTWLVIGDSCSSLPGRKAYQEELELTLAPLLRSVGFNAN